MVLFPSEVLHPVIVLLFQPEVFVLDMNTVRRVDPGSGHSRSGIKDTGQIQVLTAPDRDRSGGLGVVETARLSGRLKRRTAVSGV